MCCSTFVALGWKLYACEEGNSDSQKPLVERASVGGSCLAVPCWGRSSGAEVLQWQAIQPWHLKAIFVKKQKVCARTAPHATLTPLGLVRFLL